MMIGEKMTQTKDFKWVGEWHRWYSWHPVDLGDGRIVWREHLMRRRVAYDDGFAMARGYEYDNE